MIERKKNFKLKWKDIQKMQWGVKDIGYRKRRSSMHKTEIAKKENQGKGIEQTLEIQIKKYLLG